MYLVTGGGGFVGRHLLTRLAQAAKSADEGVWVLCRSAKRFRAEAWAQNLPHLRVIEGDVTHVADWQDQLKGHKLDGIYHLAAVVHHSRRGHEAATHANVEGTRQVVALGRRLDARVVFMSSSGTVACSPRADDAPNESAPFCEATLAGWPYYRSKVAAERLARALAPEAHQLVIVRPPIILGPGDHRFRSTGNVVRLLRGKLPFTLPGGMHFVDVRDVVAALLAAMALANPQPIYHLPGHAEGLQAFFTRLAGLAGCRPPRFALPTPVGRALARIDACLGWAAKALRRPAPHLFVDEVVVEMGSLFWNLSSAHAARDLHHAPRPANQTLADTVAWIRAHRDDCGPPAHDAPRLDSADPTP